MRVGVNEDLPLVFFPFFDRRVNFDNDLKRKFLLKCSKIALDNWDIYLSHNVSGSDLSIESKSKIFYKARVLFSANYEDLLKYTQMFDEVFDIHPVVSMEFKPVDFLVENQVDWVVFTSKRAVEFFFKKVNIRYMCDKKIAAIGSKTAFALKEKGFKLDFVPGDFYGEVLIEFLKDKGRLLIVTASKYNRIYNELDNVVILPVYENVVPQKINYFYPTGKFDFGLFSSPSAFWHMKEAFGGYEFAEKIERIVGIGKTTKSYIESCGFEVEVPERATIEDMFKYIWKQT